MMMFGSEGAEHGKKGGQPSHGKDDGGKGEERTIENKNIEHVSIKLHEKM